MLTFAERIHMLKTWILPTLLLTAKSHLANESVIGSLKLVYNAALGFDIWGVTTTQLSQHKVDRGFGLCFPFHGVDESPAFGSLESTMRPSAVGTQL